MVEKKRKEYEYMQTCRHENDIHNPLKLLIFEKEHILFHFLQIARTVPGVNRPVRKNDFERIVPGGTGFCANRPVTIFCSVILVTLVGPYLLIHL